MTEASATTGQARIWHDRAAALSVDGRAFIGGQRVAALDEATFTCHSPIDGRCGALGPPGL